MKPTLVDSEAKGLGLKQCPNCKQLLSLDKFALIKDYASGNYYVQQIVANVFLHGK